MAQRGRLAIFCENARSRRASARRQARLVAEHYQRSDQANQYANCREKQNFAQPIFRLRAVAARRVRSVLPRKTRGAYTPIPA